MTDSNPCAPQGDIQALLNREYAELCTDWRHRDGMLWQSLAVAITVTGLTLGSADWASGSGWLVRAGLFFLALLLNLVVLVKIVKDNYYQHGSSELIQRMQKETSAALCNSTDSNLRIRRPSQDYKDSRIGVVQPRWLYDWLTNRSTFQWFFAVQLFLVLLTTAGVVVCLFMAAIGYGGPDFVSITQDGAAQGRTAQQGYESSRTGEASLPRD